MPESADASGVVSTGDSAPAAVRARIDAHLFGDVAQQPWVQHVEYDSALDRWYVRFVCEGRDPVTVHFDLRPRSLHYELYFLPPPTKDPAELHAWLLRKNRSIYSARFSLDEHGATYLEGRIALEHLSEAEIDRVLGSLYECVELFTGTAAGFAFGVREQRPK